MAVLVLLTGCAAAADPLPTPGEPAPAAESAAAPAPAAAGDPPLSGLATPPAGPLPGMPAVADPHNVYAAAGAGMLAEPARAARPLVYVPHTRSGDVWFIDPATLSPLMNVIWRW